MHFQAILKIFGFKQIKTKFQYTLAVEMLIYQIKEVLRNNWLSKNQICFRNQEI